MKRILNIVIVLLVLVLVFILVYPQYKAARPTVVKLGCDRSVASLPLFIAEEEGFFKDQKVETQLLFYDDPAQALKDLFIDTLQCSIFPWFSILKKVEEGESVKVFLSGEIREVVPIEVIVTPRGSKIKLPEDLRNKRLGISPWVREILPYLIPGARAVEKSPQELLPLLDREEVDAILVLEPYRTLVLKKDIQIVQDGPFSMLLTPFPANGIGVSAKFLNRNRIDVRRMVIALNNAIGFIDKNPDKARAILAKYLNIKEEASFHLPRFQRLSEIDVPGIQSLIMRLKDKGYLSKSIDSKSLLVPPALLQ